jgi:peptide-methionine (S)-S-oxide reductase
MKGTAHTLHARGTQKGGLLRAAAKPAAGILLRLGMIGMVLSWTVPLAAADAPASRTATATFAGGCFWCMQPPFEHLDGVLSTTVGYTGGHTKNPTYEEVSAGGTGHAESVQVVYDPAKISYEKLLDVFWHNIDPLTADGQFCDHGNQYRSAIFYHDETQRRLAEASKQALEKSRRFDQPIVTQIVPATEFYPAEDYHQKYHEKNPLHYKYYRWNCGRDQRLKALWGAAPGAAPDEMEKEVKP